MEALSLPLYPVTPAQLREHEEAFSDPWIAKKLNRKRRTREHFEYLKKHVPQFLEKKTSTKFHYILDVGCGAGESLEIARYFGHIAVGIDAPPDSQEGMGAKYTAACRLMHRRQKLTVVYKNAIDELPKFPREWDCINFRGSFSQCLEHLLIGPRHSETHDSRQLCWAVGESTERQLLDFMLVLKGLLNPGGCILIALNEPGNIQQFQEMFQKVSNQVGLVDEYPGEKLMFKLRIS